MALDLLPSSHHHSVPVQQFNAEMRAADAHWQTSLSLSPDRLVAEARQATGLSNFGNDAFLTPMTILLQSAQTDAALNPFGRHVLRSHTLRALKNKLWAEAYLARHPAIRHRKIVAPIIIIGPHRSGTTRLQRMLASDGRLQHLRAWEGFNPVPRQDDAGLDAASRHDEVRQMLEVRQRLYPHACLAHPMQVDAAEEEMLLLNQSFAGFSPLGFYHVPDYYRWFLDASKDFAYAHMADLMRIISSVRGDPEDKRWMLKNPQHLLDLDTLLQTFPDAKLILTHRDPIKTAGSVMSLMWHYAVQHTDAPCRITIRDTWLDFTEQMARRAIAARRRMAPGQQIDIHYHDMNRDWQGVMARIYDFAGLELTAPARQAMADWLRHSEADNHHGGHRYQLEDFGVTAQEVDARLDFVRQQYRIPYESA